MNLFSGLFFSFVRRSYIIVDDAHGGKIGATKHEYATQGNKRCSSACTGLPTIGSAASAEK